MGDIISFPSFDQEEHDLLALSADELKRLLANLRQQIEQLDLAEPADMDSEEYMQGGEAHEELEDQIDEILDRLDELE